MSLTLTDAEVIGLGEGDVVVRDDFLGREPALALAAEAEDLAAAGARPAGIGRGGELHLDRSVRGDDIVWLEDDRGGPALAAWWQRMAAVAAELDRACWLGVRGIEIQLAIYRRPGAAYARHADAFRGRALRRATLLYYLNRDWRPEHGGVLRAFTPRGVRDLEPRLDRAVLFLSDRLEHEVLSTTAPRLALTAWFRGPEIVP